ncbi:MAG: hypothetical protein OEW36_10580, partial [Hylemonella sp.]|nr:hypothetical protein [Hylemonella sp.]
AFALNVAITDTDARVGVDAGIDGANALLLDASSRNQAATQVEGGSKGSTAVTPVIGITVASNETLAGFAANAGPATTLLGDVTVQAAHAGSATTEVAGDTSSGNTGVGISLGLTIATDLVSASTARDLMAGAAMSFSARSTADARTKAKASVAGGAQSDAPAAGSSEESEGGVNKKVGDSRDFADQRASSKGGAGKTAATDKADAGAADENGQSKKVQVAGAAAVTVADSASHAVIQDGLTVAAIGTVSLRAENNTDGQALADASAVGPNVKFDPTATGVVDFDNETLKVGKASGLKTGDAVAYRSNGGTGIEGLSDGGRYYVRLVGEDKVALYDTQAHAKADASDTTGRVNLLDSPAAAGTTHSLDSGPDGTGVGIAVAVNVGLVDNQATLGNGILSSGGLLVEATMADVDGDRTHSFLAQATSGASAGDTGVAGALAVNVGLSDARASVADSADLTLTGELRLRAENRAENSARASSLAESHSGVGVGASIAVNVGETDTRALLGDGVTASGVVNLALEAESANQMLTTGAGGAKGDTAVTPVIVVAVGDNDTDAAIGLGAALSVSDSIHVLASHEGASQTEAEGDTKSGDTGVGISLAVNVQTDSAVSSTARDLAAGGSVSFTAKTATASRAKAKASVAGAADQDANDNPAQGGQSKNVDQKVQGQTGAANQRSTSAGGKGSANTSQASAETAEGSGGGQGTKVSVAGAVAINVANSTSDASIGSGIQITAGASSADGVLSLLAENNTDAQAWADGSATVAGGGTSVGAAVAVNVAVVSNRANLDAGASVTADGYSARAVAQTRDTAIEPESTPVVDVAKNSIFVGAKSGLS